MRMSAWSLHVCSPDLWCRGFLGSFGLAAGKDPPLSDESREALTNIARLAAASPQDDGDEEDEQALAEIEEFVRVATLLLHGDCALGPRHRKNLNRSEEHTSELQSLMRISYAVFCLQKKKQNTPERKILNTEDT